MIRVLHIVGKMDAGGAETLLMNLYRQLDRSQVQFDFLVHRAGAGQFDDEIRALGGRVFLLQKPRFLSLQDYAKHLQRILNQHGPFAAVHSHVSFFSGYVLQIARSVTVPIRIAHSHSTSDGKPDGYVRNAYRKLMRILIHRNATHMLACSRAASQALYGKDGASEPRVSVLVNAIDLSPYRNLSSDKKALRGELSLPMGGPLIGHVGNFRPPKNHEFLVELMAELLPRMPEAQLVLVGDGPLRPDIEHLADRKGIRDHVLFLGVRSDVHRILGALDLFLFPSLFEGLPLALVEAQAAGLPCVTSDAIPEEADAGLGLIKIASLHDGTSKWVSLTIEQLQLPYVAWVKREEALWQTGHDIRRLADRLTGIYLDG